MLFRSLTLHNPLFLLVLTTVVDAIERELLLQKQNHKLNIMNQIMLSKTINAIIITDSNGKIMEFNNFAEIITGYKKEKIIGKSVYDSKIMGSFFSDVLNNQESYGNVEVKYENNNNKECVCLADIQPIHDGKYNIIGAFGQFRDITERYLAEEKYNYLANHDELTEIGRAHV